MSTTKDDGGPAFPRATSLEPNTGKPWNEEQQGMSLRDWFAGMALQGIIAGKFHHALMHMTEEQRKNPGELCYGVAWNAYTLADAMLAERNK